MSSFGEFRDLFGPDGFRSTPTVADRRAYAESLGYKVNGTSASIPFGVTTQTVNLDQFTPPQFRNGGRGNMLNSMFSALERDISQQQSAANEQYAAQQGVIADTRATVGGIGSRMSRLAGETAGNLELQAANAEQLGADQLAAMQGRYGQVSEQISSRTDDIFNQLGAHGETLDRAEGNIDEGFSIFDKAVSRMQGVIQGYTDATAAQASSVVGGIKRNLSAVTQQIQNGLNPDGTLMTAAERADSMQRLQFSTNQQIQDNVTQIFGRFNEVKAQLGTQLANLTAQSGQARLQGAQLRTDIARERRAGAETALGAAQLESSTLLELGRQMLGAEAGQREMQQLSAGLHQQANAIRNSAEFASIQYELQGLTTLSQMISNNPRQTVSWFAGLAQMYALATAPGGRFV